MKDGIARKIRVYIASPLTKGEPTLNIRFQAMILNELQLEGRVFPLAPLSVAHFNEMYPQPESFWLEYTLEMMEMCDCVLRLPATCDARPEYHQWESNGCAGEVLRAKELDKPVFFSKAELYDWVHRCEHP